MFLSITNITVDRQGHLVSIHHLNFYVNQFSVLSVFQVTSLLVIRTDISMAGKTSIPLIIVSYCRDLKFNWQDRNRRIVTTNHILSANLAEGKNAEVTFMVCTGYIATMAFCNRGLTNMRLGCLIGGGGGVLLNSYLHHMYSLSTGTIFSRNSLTDTI